MLAGSAWFFYALSASFLWGLGYAISDKLLRVGLQPAFLMFLSTLICLPLYFILAAKFNELKSGFDLVFNDWKTLAWLIVMGVTVVGGNFLILMSVSEKNATLASLVEVTYPLFTFLFAWWLLKEVQLGWETAVGGLLIFSGVAVIYFKS